MKNWFKHFLLKNSSCKPLRLYARSFSEKATIVTLVAFSLLSCETEMDDCPITADPLTDDDLRIPNEFVYRGLGSAELFFITGECFGAKADVDWEYSGEAEFRTPGNTNNRFEFLSSGTLCGQLLSGGKVSERICQDIQVYRDQVWGRYHEDFPGGESKQQVTFTLNGDVYSGFGNFNNWYRFDTTTFEWHERAAIPNLVDFNAYAGFAIRDKGYVVGNNSKYYEYDFNTDRWTEKGSFPESVSRMLNLGAFPARNEYNFPVIGVSIDGKGYFGIGNQTSLYEYDAALNTWTKLADRPEQAKAGDHSFAYQGKVYNGQYVYDIASDSWFQGTSNFNASAGFSPGFVNYKGVMYGAQNSRTLVFDGTSLEELELNEANSFTGAPAGLIGNGAATGNFLIYPRLMGVNGRDEAKTIYYINN